jgi:hypothetical protein
MTPDIARSLASSSPPTCGRLRPAALARRIALDALDVMLALLPDAAARRREVYRLHDWLNANGFTPLIAAKAVDHTTHGVDQQPSASYGSWSTAQSEGNTHLRELRGADDTPSAVPG